MKEKMCKRNSAIYTFLSETKDGKYSVIDANIVDTPRITEMREEFIVNEDMPVYFSMINQL